MEKVLQEIGSIFYWRRTADEETRRFDNSLQNAVGTELPVDHINQPMDIPEAIEEGQSLDSNPMEGGSSQSSGPTEAQTWQWPIKLHTEFLEIQTRVEEDHELKEALVSKWIIIRTI